jgi:hypothetical protein
MFLTMNCPIHAWQRHTSSKHPQRENDITAILGEPCTWPVCCVTRLAAHIAASVRHDAPQAMLPDTCPPLPSRKPFRTHGSVATLECCSRSLGSSWSPPLIYSTYVARRVCSLDSHASPQRESSGHGVNALSRCSLPARERAYNNSLSCAIASQICST